MEKFSTRDAKPRKEVLIVTGEEKNREKAMILQNSPNNLVVLTL